MTQAPRQPRDGPAPPDLLLRYLVVLADTDPLVWRRIVVPASCTFWGLHVAIQDAMGWEDYHLHEFRVVDPRSGTVASLGIPDPDGPADPDRQSVAAGWEAFPLDYLSGGASPMEYVYDFGDDWQHAVVFEDYEHAEDGPAEPRCLAGAGACPPEDVGGPGGYARFLVIMADPEHPQHAEYLEWVGGPFDPEEFSPDEVWFDDPEVRWRMAFEDDEEDEEEG